MTAATRSRSILRLHALLSHYANGTVQGESIDNSNPFIPLPTPGPLLVKTCSQRQKLIAHQRGASIHQWEKPQPADIAKQKPQHKAFPTRNQPKQKKPPSSPNVND